MRLPPPFSRFDALYYAGLAAATPWLLVSGKARRKVLAALRERNGRVSERSGDRPCILLHAVSVGEVNATPALVEALNEAGIVVVVSATTDTGFKRAKELFGINATAGRYAVRFPIDTTAAVERFLDAVRPGVVATMELEVWPNLVKACAGRGIPAAVINGRVTDSSFRGYKRLGPIVRPTFARLATVLAQEQTYAKRFVDLGVPADRVSVAGSMKFDTAQIADRVEGDAKLAAIVGLKPRALGMGDHTVLVCGSTGPGEEALLSGIYETLRKGRPNLRLVVVPRKPDRFDEVADLLSAVAPVMRRSTGEVTAPSGKASGPPIVLGDTMGELRAFYSLADLVVVGRTLVDLGEKQHGSDMIEPCALAKPTIVGRYIGNFAAAVQALLAGGGIVLAQDTDELIRTLERWLNEPSTAKSVGQAGQRVVEQQRGGTRRTAESLKRLLK